MKRFAIFISRIFDPIVVLSITTLVVSPQHALVLFLFLVLPPTAALLWALRSKKVKSIDVSDRHERIKVLTAIMLFLLVDFFILQKLHISSLIFLYTMFLFWFAGFFLITLVYKISGHVGIATLVGLLWWPLLFAVPLVAWSRIVLKRHTKGEVVAGFLYSLLFYEAWQGIL